MINVTIDQLSKMGNVPNRISMGNDFCIIDFRYDPSFYDFLKYPCHLDAFLAFFCVSGDFRLMINMTEVSVSANTLFVNSPNNIIRVSDFNPDTVKDLHFILVAVSEEYMSGLKMDAGRLFTEEIQILETPCISLNEDERQLAAGYLSIIEKMLQYPFQYKKECLGSLISSVCYLIGAIWDNRLQEAAKLGRLRMDARNRSVVTKFLSLVSEYHVSERTVIFYADKMCLTPKYLSKLIKNATGRSAPEWIDSFVILEAKSMLKYSPMPIKEIVSRLNFPNQSVFHKFFKAHTGMTPNEYRNS